MSALTYLGIDIPPGGGEIDLVMAYVSGSVVVVVSEVKRADTFPWKADEALPNKQAVNKAEIQLTKDVMFLKSVLAGVPSSEIRFHTVACFPDTSMSKLQTIICPSCLERDVICLDDIEDLSLLQKKTQVPDKPNPATTSGKKKLLTLSARSLNHHDLLNLGYRPEDKEKRASEKQTFNVDFADKKVEQNEFVVASPQQQQVIASFTASSTKRHLVLEGPAGTGKTLVALQVANNLLESATDTFDTRLVVTTHRRQRGGPIQEYLVDSSNSNRRYKGWWDIMKK